MAERIARTPKLKPSSSSADPFAMATPRVGWFAGRVAGLQRMLFWRKA